MVVPTNTVTEHSMVGTREDLENAIYNIAPTDTPAYTELERVTADQANHEWQTDNLRPAATNRNIEGDDATATTFSPTTRVNNHCQISREVVSVSGTTRASNQAGRGDTLSYEVAKKGKELKRDIELAITQNQASSAGGSATARSSASMESWLSTNKTSVGTGTAQTTPGFSGGLVAAPTDSTDQGTFTKDSLDTVIQAAWTEGGAPTTIMTGPFNRTKFSLFSGISTLETRADANTEVALIGGADMYKSNYGILKVVPNRFQRDRTVLVLDMELFAIATLRPLDLYELAKTGDSDKRLLLMEWTLVSRNEAGSGKIADCTTS